MCVPTVIGGLAVWRYNNQKKKISEYTSGRSTMGVVPSRRLRRLTADLDAWAHCVSGQPAFNEAHPGGGAGAIVRKHEKRVFRVYGDLLRWRMQIMMASVRMARLAAVRWVCLGQLSTRRSDALPTFLWAASPLRGACVFIIGLESVKT